MSKEAGRVNRTEPRLALMKHFEVKADSFRTFSPNIQETTRYFVTLKCLYTYTV